MARVLIHRLDPDLPIPSYARPGDAGLDLRARADTVLHPGGGRAAIQTGIAVAVPDGFAGFVVPRSGLALRHGVSIVNAPGVIDSGYRGEVLVVLLNTDPSNAFRVSRGDRIAQLVIVPVALAELAEVDELPDSARAAGGFGHSGR